MLNLGQIISIHMHCGMKYIVKVQFGESTLFVPLFRFFLKRGAPNWAEPTKKHSKKLSYTSNVILAYFSKKLILFSTNTK